MSSYRLLGNIEIVGPRGVAPLRTPRHQIVLAMLLVNAGHVVPVGRLVNAVWDGAPPTSARNQIHICISALRRLLKDVGLPDAISTRSPGYLLDAKPGELDLHEFDQHVVSAQTAQLKGESDEAVAYYSKALSLWRGEPFSGIECDAFRAIATNLKERHLTAVEDRIEILLGLGRTQEIVSELLELSAAHPLRERLHVLTMRALCGVGRRAEALNAYHRASHTLIGDIGVEPGPQLQNLYQSILADDRDAQPAAVPAVHPPVCTLPPAPADFTGRQKELGEITGALTGSRGRGHHPPIVTITGMVGSGKTSLAVRAGYELAETFPDGQLYVSLSDGAARARRPAEILARILRFFDLPADRIPDGLDERAETYRALVAPRRVLVILDGAARAEQVAPLLPGGGNSGVIVTSRTRRISLPGHQRVEVGSMEPAEAVEFLGRMAGRDRLRTDPAAARELADLCGRLPLTLRAAGSQLAARPHWTVPQLVTRLADEYSRFDQLGRDGGDVRTALALAYGAMDEQARRLFRRLASLPGREFDTCSAMSVLNVSADQAEDILESLADMYLLTATTANPLRYRYHDLVRLYATERFIVHEPDRRFLDVTPPSVALPQRT
ncbi:AfsR/SARP family transcriptional regulator [Actinomadura sp. 1N219]|uniref:AfsR/SARP family transcriptional regulator n=1 Tax=Actinomadura sp. 1N219 TaxID=3375152 RepID=UPI00379EA8B0